MPKQQHKAPTLIIHTARQSVIHQETLFTLTHSEHLLSELGGALDV